MQNWPAGKVILPIEKLHDHLRGKKIALMMNATARDNDGAALIDVIPAYTDVEVSFFIGMEHGVRGDLYAGDPGLQSVDKKTGLPIVNLYDYPDWRPPVEPLKTVDAVVFCAQDTGVRHWTYTPWMLTLIDAAAKAGCEVVIPDRPNPMGDAVEGNATEEQYRYIELLNGFGYPLRHGMTIGELALMYNETQNVGCKLTVLPMEGYRRDMYYEQTGLPWLPPSPNIPTVDSCFYFNATGLMQGSSVGLGRGTTTPFQYVGAPWMDGEKVTNELNRRNLPGVYCVQKFYKANYAGEKDVLCDGFLMVCHDRKAFQPVKMQLNIIDVLTQLHPNDFALDKHYLSVIRHGTADLVETVKSGKSALSLEEKWQAESAAFMEARKPYLLYA